MNMPKIMTMKATTRRPVTCGSSEAADAAVTAVRGNAGTAFAGMDWADATIVNLFGRRSPSPLPSPSQREGFRISRKIAGILP